MAMQHHLNMLERAAYAEEFELDQLAPIREIAYEGRHPGSWELYQRNEYRLGIVCICRHLEESWYLDCYVPRDALLCGLRAARQLGFRVNTPFGCLPCWFPIGTAYYSGPGMRFADKPRYRRINRDWYVFSQHGGRDI